MTIKKVYIPVVRTKDEVIQIGSEMLCFLADDFFGVDLKLDRIEFDDLSFDTPTPRLPFWYRLNLYFNKYDKKTR